MAKAGTKNTSTKSTGPKNNGPKNNGTKKTSTKNKWKSRAVTRLIEAGSMTDCTHCDERVKFKAREKHQQVICNVYIGGRWNRVEHFHAPCYKKAGQPFGEPVE